MSILKSRNFLPLFLTQFLGAFNDNLLKNAVIALITFKLAVTSGGSTGILVTAAAGIFILPFFIFSATAGQMSDKYDRGQMARYVKIAEIGIMILAFAAFMSSSVPLLMIVIFLMGTHSAFFGPIKYAILPQHLDGKDLLAGNAYVEAGTFLAILLGTILGGLLVMVEGTGPVIISIAVLIVAVLGYLASRMIPPAPGPSPEIVINKNIWAETKRILLSTQDDHKTYRALLAISWFWFVGATYLAQFPAFAKEYLGGDEKTLTAMLTIFSLGIGIGSILCNKLLKGRVDTTYVPLAAIGMAVFGIDLYFAANAATLSTRVMIDLFLVAVSGGLFTVPLYSYIQKRTDQSRLARLIAGLNIMNAMFMVVSALLSMVLLKMGFTIPEIFLGMACLNILVAIYIVHLLPDDLFRSVAKTVLGWAYRVEVKGLENVDMAGKRALIIANHTSFLDAALIAAYLPVRITFAINTYIAKQWWIKPFLKLVDVFPVDPTNPMAIKSLVDVVKSDKIGMIFPEGRITVTGSLMKVYEGPGLIADKAGAKILPVRIDGAQYTPFSRLKGKVAIRSFPKITLTVLPPRDFVLPKEVMGRKRRQMAAAQLYDTMSSMVFDASVSDKTLLQSLCEARDIHGGGHIIAEDPMREPVSYNGFVTRAFVLSRILKKHVATDDAADVKAVGVMLPNMVGTSVTFFALHALRITPAMLNFSAGPAQVLSACKTALLKTVITSRRFIEMGKMDATVTALAAEGIKFVYLEDLRNEVGLADKLYGLAASRISSFLPKDDVNNAAVILFTSGSEGNPKGVVLSHRNIRSNIQQVGSRIDFGPRDIVFNCLPMFHSFGLTGGTLLPILSGIRAFYYPSPLHYRIVPELIYDTNATILFGTDTFLSGYARFAHPYDFHAIRYVFAGAEKLREETRKTYAEKYGVRIFEGYGATETAPVISINTPMHNRPGSVGRLLPGMTGRLDKVEGLDDNVGRLVIKGPNIMSGYLKSDAPGKLQPPEEGWYDTGDIVSIDADGYVTIQGRLKRFAKIAGEMVSLTAVEGAMQKLYPEKAHAVVSVKDEKKGERLILFTTEPNAKPEDILAHFRKLGLSELSVPKQVNAVAEIPLLGTGKTDYVRLNKMAAEG